MAGKFENYNGDHEGNIGESGGQGCESEVEGYHEGDLNFVKDCEGTILLVDTGHFQTWVVLC